MCFKIGRIGLCALHGTKCPLLMGVFFSFGQPQPQHQLGLRKHLILPSFVVFCCFSNHRTIASRLHRKLKFGTQAHFNPTRGNIKKQIGVTCPPPQNRVKPKTSTSTSRQPRKLEFGMQAYFNSNRRKN